MTLLMNHGTPSPSSRSQDWGSPSPHYFRLANPVSSPFPTSGLGQDTFMRSTLMPQIPATPLFAGKPTIEGTANGTLSTSLPDTMTPGVPAEMTITFTPNPDIDGEYPVTLKLRMKAFTLPDNESRGPQKILEFVANESLGPHEDYRTRFLELTGEGPQEFRFPVMALLPGTHEISLEFYHDLKWLTSQDLSVTMNEAS